jgi:hypothetical protein
MASHSLLCLRERCGGRHLLVDAINAGLKDGTGYTCPRIETQIEVVWEAEL